MDKKTCAEPGCTKKATEGEFCREHALSIGGKRGQATADTMEADLRNLDERKLTQIFAEVSEREEVRELGEDGFMNYLDKLSDQDMRKVALKRYEYLIEKGRRLAEGERREREKGVEGEKKYYVDIDADPHSSVTYKVLRAKEEKKNTKKSPILGGRLTRMALSDDTPFLLVYFFPLFAIVDVFLLLRDLVLGNIKEASKEAEEESSEEEKAEIDRAEVIFRGKLRIPNWVSEELGGG